MKNSKEFLVMLGNDETIEQQLNDIITTVNSVLNNEKQTVMEVFGYGNNLGKIFGILRFTTYNIKYRNVLATKLNLSTSFLELFRKAYGNYAFIKGVELVQERKMDISLVKECVVYALNKWNIKFDDSIFSELTEENIDKQYTIFRQRAEEEYKLIELSGINESLMPDNDILED